MNTKTLTARVSAAVLCLLQICAVAVPAMAATQVEPEPKAVYAAYRVDADSMILDGQVTTGEPWDAVNWTEPFVKQESDTIDPEDAPADVTGKAKFLWSYEGEAGAATSANLYMLLTFQDPDGVWTAHDSESFRSDCFVVSIDETNTYNYSDSAIGKDNAKSSLQHLSGSMFTEDVPMILEHKDSKWCHYYVRRDGNTVTVEARVEFRGAAEYAKAEHTIKFGVAIYRTVREEGGSVIFQKNAWGGPWPNTKNTATLPTITLKEAFPEGYELPPEPTEPEPTEPEATEPKETKPAQTRPQQTQPKPTEPGTTDEMPDNGGLWIVLAVVAVVVVAGVVTLVVVKKKKA